MNRKEDLWARLDRALVNVSFLYLFPMASVANLDKNTLDRKPLLLKFTKSIQRYGPLTFSSCICRLLMKGFYTDGALSVV